MFYNINISAYKRDHVLSYIKEQKKINPNYKVLDIGASANYTEWSYDVVDYVVDINDFKDDRVKTFAININYEDQWDELLEFVNANGKFDFCICSHTLEDIAMPAIALSKMPLIANEGFIAVPSKYREFSRVANQPWLGYIHHRWIYTFKDDFFLALPKLNFIEYVPEFIKIGNPSESLADLSFFWKDEIKFKILNDDYLGPSVEDVLHYYYYSLLNDSDILSTKS